MIISDYKDIILKREKIHYKRDGRTLWFDESKSAACDILLINHFV